jgi:hypothetical protein
MYNFPTTTLSRPKVAQGIKIGSFIRRSPTVICLLGTFCFPVRCFPFPCQCSYPWARHSYLYFISSTKPTYIQCGVYLPSSGYSRLFPSRVTLCCSCPFACPHSPPSYSHLALRTLCSVHSLNTSDATSLIHYLAWSCCGLLGTPLCLPQRSTSTPHGPTHHARLSFPAHAHWKVLEALTYTIQQPEPGRAH